MTKDEPTKWYQPPSGVTTIRIIGDLVKDCPMYNFWKSDDHGCLDRKDKLAKAEPIECEIVE